MRVPPRYCRFCFLACLLAAAGAAQTTSGDGTAVAAFERIVPVLHNARCMNCHSTGNFPRQGDDSHPHTMQVRRGPDGHGVNAVQCSTCHQEHNMPGLHMPPGAPDWHLPSPDMPMVWEGPTDRQLCGLLKNPAQSGHRTVQQIVAHMTTSSGARGVASGGGPKSCSDATEEFVANVKDWAAGGAVCPGS
jgi:hypothetical protein